MPWLELLFTVTDAGNWNISIVRGPASSIGLKLVGAWDGTDGTAGRQRAMTIPRRAITGRKPIMRNGAPSSGRTVPWPSIAAYEFARPAQTGTSSTHTPPMNLSVASRNAHGNKE